MKQEIKDIAVELATKTTPAVGAAWYSDISLTTALTVMLVMLQILYLLRKWWREETQVGQVMRAWSDRKGLTRPADLDD
jgi:uncharacterized protein HemY